MKDPRTIDGEWNAIRRHTLFDDYDDPDAHSPLASLASRKRIRRGVDWVLLTIERVRNFLSGELLR